MPAPPSWGTLGHLPPLWSPHAQRLPAANRSYLASCWTLENHSHTHRKLAHTKCYGDCNLLQEEDTWMEWQRPQVDSV